MPNGGLNVGRDYSLRLNSVGSNLELPVISIEKVNARPTNEVKKYVPINGLMQPVLFHIGWELDITLARRDNRIDLWWALLEAQYFNGVPQPGGFLSETITEADGSRTQFMYTDLVLELTDAGTYAGNEFVIQTLKGYASRKEKML